MNKPLAILTLTAFGCSTAAAWFHSELKAERQRNDELQTRIAHLEASRAPNPFAPAPRKTPPEPDPISESVPKKPVAALASTALVTQQTARSHERARDAVAHILTGEQLAKYEEIQERELTLRRAHLRIQRAELERQGDAGAGNAIISVNGNSFSSYSFAPATEVVAEQ